VASSVDLWAAIVLGALAYEGLGFALAFFISGDLEGLFVIILVFMLDAFVAGPVGGASGLWPNLSRSTIRRRWSSTPSCEAMSTTCATPGP
jgi:hypothetical protein